MPSGPSEPRRSSRSGLFGRIYLTFIVAAIAAALMSAAGTWLVLQRLGDDWIGTTMERVAEEHDALLASLADSKAVHDAALRLQDALKTRVSVYDARGRRLAGDGPRRAPRHARRVRRQLARGFPVVLERQDARHPPVLLFPLRTQDGEAAGFVHVMARDARPQVTLVVAGVVGLGALALGAWTLSRSLARRLARLERSVDRIAHGDLAHRVELDATRVRDELDLVGVAFNQMANKVETLVQGQRTLLANVSHELRTPIARIKVLLEILDERVEALTTSGAATGLDKGGHVARLRSGLQEMHGDTAEIEALISDLLTSGRLELRGGDQTSLEWEPVDIARQLSDAASKFGAEVSATAASPVVGDSMLLSRLWSNLLANARRACPTNEITITAQSEPGWTQIAVEDEGPGIAPEHRETVFEPFHRLDAARDRDAGGVGLGLYLCRQIATAHGGTIVASGRTDGRSGARMVVRLPAV